MRSTILKFFFFLSLSIYINAIQFQFSLAPKETKCFFEYLTRNTHAIGYVMINSDIRPHFSLNIYDQESNTYFNKLYDPQDVDSHFSKLEEIYKVRLGDSYTNESFHNMVRNEHHGDINKINFAFASLINGDHHFCTRNDDKSSHIYEFELKTGVDAKDYSSILKKSHLQPSETKILMINDYIKKMKRDTETIWVEESQKIGLAETFNFNLVWTSVLTMTIIVVFSFFQYYAMKNFFREKKII